MRTIKAGTALPWPCPRPRPRPHAVPPPALTSSRGTLHDSVERSGALRPANNNPCRASAGHPPGPGLEVRMFRGRR